MQEWLSPDLVAAVLSGLLGLGAAAVRVWSRVAVARQQRRTMTAVADSLSTNGRSVRAHQRMPGAEWSIELHAHHEPGSNIDSQESGRHPAGDSAW